MFPWALNIMMPGIRRVANARIVVVHFVPKCAAANNLAVGRGGGRRDTLAVNFNSNVVVEGTAFPETTITRSHIQH
jgi:hypothetical protein